MDMNELVKTAILKALKADPKAINEGTFRLDGTRVIVELGGTITKFPAEWHTPTTSIPLIPSLALMLRDMGFQREQVMEKLEVAMNAALAMNEQAEGYINEFNSDCAALTQKVRASAKTLPPHRHEGKIVPKDVKIEVVVNLGPALVASATVPAPAP